MGQYCPKCFSNETFLPPASIVHVVINDMRMDPDYILFDPNHKGEVFKRDIMDSAHLLLVSNQKRETFERDLSNQVKNFFAWSKFLRNKAPIKKVKVFSNDYRCVNQCALKCLNISVVNHLISPSSLMNIIETVARSHSIEVKIGVSDIC